MKSGRIDRMNEEIETSRVNFNKKGYVKSAENVIRFLKDENFHVVTNRKNGKGDDLTMSAIRNILSETSAIYDTVRSQGVETARIKLSYLKVKLVYQSGRNAAVKRFVKVSNLLGALDEVNEYYEKPEEKEWIILFCRYMEALVAYFKYYGGKD